MALFPLYLTEVLGSSVTVVGAVISAYLILDIVTRTPAGWLADRWGRRSVLLTGVALSAPPLVLMMWTRSSSTFLLLNALNGLGAGCIWPAIYATVADTYRRSERWANSPDDPTGRPLTEGDHHLLDCLRYLCMARPMAPPVTRQAAADPTLGINLIRKLRQRSDYIRPKGYVHEH